MTRTLDITTIPAYVMNLDSRPDRWALFNQIDLGLPNLQRFPAIKVSMETLFTRKDISESTKIRIFGRVRRSHEEIDSYGGIGCSLGHITLWKDLLESNASHMAIFEDDPNLNPFRKPGSMAEYLQSEIDALPSEGWDVWLAGYNRIRDCNPWETPDSVPRISQSVTRPEANCQCNAEYLDVRSFFGTHCYIISREGARKMLDHALPIESHIDAYMGVQAQLGRVRIIASGSPFHITNSMSDTDIPHGSALICSLGINDGYYKIFTYVLLVFLIGIIMALIIQVKYGKSLLTVLRERLHCPMNPRYRGPQICSIT
jgi:GR25 family glycosyltransferase involved in LPS biosynthesis